MTLDPNELRAIEALIVNAPRTAIPQGLNQIPDGTAWPPRDEASLGLLNLIRQLNTQIDTPPKSVGISTVWPAASAIPPGSTQSFVLPIPTPFVEINALQMVFSNANPGPGISSLDVALYDTKDNRAAGTFALTDPGLQFLAPNLVLLAAGGLPVTYDAAVLGLMQGSLNGTVPVLWGLVRNNDGVSTFDATIAVEAYERKGSRAT